MLILHPKSTCDVCFDSYVSSERVPYVIKCGHILCENCINKLPEPSICPFCRMPFDRDEEQLRLHIDTATNALSTPLLIRRSEVSLSESATQAQQYLSRITDIVLGGAKAVEVRELIDEIGEWFSDQEEEFRELQTAWLLLKKHSQKKSDLRQCLEDKKELEQQVEFQKNVSDTVQKRLEKYKESNMKMEEQLAELEKERDQLEQKYRYAMLQYTQMAEENVRLKNDRKTSPPLRPAESRYNRLENDSDAMAISLPKEKAFDPDMFTLSPAPSSANIPALKSTAPRFRPLTEESDTEDLRPSAYTMRSVQPISIKPSREIYRKPSIGYQEMDVSSRSIPQGSVDVQMSGCSSSPIVSGFQHGSSREIAGPSNYRDREFRRPSVSRRPTLDSPAEEIGEDEMIRGELGRQKLQEILSSPAIMTTGMPAVESRRYSPESHSIPHTRNPSPISRGSSAAPNVLSSASSAAQQAERDRQERNRLAMATKDPTQQSQYSSSSSQQYNNYNRDIMHPQPTMPQRPQYTRRGSDSGNFRAKSHSVSSMSSSSMPMSNLAKSIRANQDGQRGQ